MKRYLLFLLGLLGPALLWGQSEIVSNVLVGGGLDFTVQPIHPQSSLSKSQTIYYIDQLAFKGEINQISYRVIFWNSSLENSDQWVIKMGTTDWEEFGVQTGFIDESELTEVFSGIVSATGYDVIIELDEPFYYDGLQNLVIQVEEVAPGVTPNATSGFKGTENFNNPPTRSIMSFIEPSGTSTVYENSYPMTYFYGNLERCIKPVIQSNVQNITQTSATLNFQDNSDVTLYHYVAYPENTEMPSQFETTASDTVILEDLLAAENYVFTASSDCDDPYLIFATKYFNTKPLEISVPHTITFDGNFTRDYYLSSGSLGNISVSETAADNTQNGLWFRSVEYTPNVPAFSTSGNIWNTNSNYKTKADFIIDLTDNPVNPVFSFRLKQNKDAWLRVVIDNFQVSQNFMATGVDDSEFETVVIDLRDYVGKKINLSIEHISGFYSQFNQRSSRVDTIELKESGCVISDQEITVSKTDSTITVTSTDTDNEYDITIIPQSVIFADDSWDNNVTLPYTLEDLSPATAYKIYIRKKCSTELGSWYEIYVTTDPTTIFPPHIELFSTNSNSSFVAPLYNKASEITFAGSNNVVALHQRQNPLIWFGGVDTTESEAWNENEKFISSLYMIVDTQNLTSLSMTIKNRMRTFYLNSSWFRILINGEQYGPSYQGTSNTSPFQDLIIDLDEFVGDIIDVELQHSGRSVGFSFNGIDDRIDIRSVTFSGTLGTESRLVTTLKAYPNPVENELYIEGEYLLGSISVYDVQGRPVPFVREYFENSIAIDTRNWASGVYFLKIENQEGSLIRKIIKK